MGVGVIGAHRPRLTVTQGAAHRYGDGLAVVQRDDQIAAGDWVVKRGGVDDGATLGDRCGGRQRHGGGVVVIVDRSRCRARNVERLELATGGAGDLGRDRLGSLGVGVIGAHGHRVTAGRGAAHRDGDGLAVVQRDDQVAAGDRVVHRSGVDDGATLGDRWGGHQRHGGGVGFIVDRRRCGARGVERLEPASCGARDLGGDRLAALGVGVTGAYSPRVAVTGGAAHGDGDGAAVVQCDDQVAASDRVAHRSGVNDGAALGDRRGGRQRHGGRVGVIADRSRCRARGVERLELTTRGAGDPCGDRLGALGVGVIGAYGHRVAVTGGAPHRDGDGLAVVQCDDQVAAGDGVVDRGRVDDEATLGDFGGGRQRHCRRRFVSYEHQSSGVKRSVLLLGQPSQRQWRQRTLQDEAAGARVVQRQQLLDEQVLRDGQISCAQHHDHWRIRAQDRVGTNR